MRLSLIRMTHQREVVLDELRNSYTHPTADELYVNVRKKLPRISLATIYRTLETLEQVGLVKKITIDCNQMRFDGNVEDHYHITCVQCGRVDDIPSSAIKKVEVKTGEVDGYTVIGHQIHFFGICNTCGETDQQQSGEGN